MFCRCRGENKIKNNNKKKVRESHFFVFVPERQRERDLFTKILHLYTALLYLVYIFLLQHEIHFLYYFFFLQLFTKIPTTYKFNFFPFLSSSALFLLLFFRLIHIWWFFLLLFFLFCGCTFFFIYFFFISKFLLFSHFILLLCAFFVDIFHIFFIRTKIYSSLNKSQHEIILG